MLNEVNLIGHIGKPPEFLETGKDGSTVSVLKFSMATTERWRDKVTDDKMEATEWHQVTIFGNLAVTMNKYLKGGALVFVKGAIKTSSWHDAEGVKHWKSGIIASAIQMLDKKSSAPEVPV